MPGSSRFERAKNQGHYEAWVKELMDKIESFDVKEVAITALVLDTDSVDFKDDEAIEVLADSIYVRRKRLLNYPLVQKDSMKVIAGNHRILAAKHKGEKTIPVRILDVPDDEAWAMTIEENLTRRKVSQKELYRRFKRARDEWAWDQEMMSHLAGLSEGYISKILKWGDGGFEGKASRVHASSSVSPGNYARTVDEAKTLSAPEISDSNPPEAESELSGRESGPSRQRTNAEGTDDPRPSVTVERESFSRGTSSEQAIPKAAATPAIDSQPSGFWSLDELRSNRGKMNGYIQSAAKFAQVPDMKVWLASAYHYLKEALGYDK